MRYFIRKLTKKSKYSYMISIPKSLIKDFKWKERQKIKIIPNIKRKSLEIKNWEK